MRINWFSPLPPARTDVAHYTARVLGPLSKIADVTLWSDRKGWDRELENHAIVRYFEPDKIDWTELNRGDATFFHMGNNVVFHGSIWQASRLHSGFVVLHDFRFHHFFVEMFCSFRQRPDLYLQEMTDRYGAAARQEAEKLLEQKLDGIDQMALRFPLTQSVLENSIGALVHSREAFESLKNDDGVPVAFAPLPFSSMSEKAANKPLSDIQNINKSEYRLVVFGYLAPNRRLEQLLVALASMPERESFRLDVYGDLWDRKLVQQQIRDLGIGNLVHLHGFVPEAELDNALSSSHLAINLRYPTMGEASGSQLRCWFNALPSMVTRTGWYATLPESTVAFVRPDSEIEDIQTHLRHLIQDPSRFVEMGTIGRRLLDESHSPETYARSICELAGRASVYRRRTLSRKWAMHTGNKLADLGKAATVGKITNSVASNILKITG